ncbi:hypothetical protein NKI63_14710 [Mesorhizobium sp. M0410]|uniref:hypothetical protein n=1 Tax=Mesorhizobium sp. M0410 TaxID=2956943 RepID=UPI003338DECC
MPLIHSALIETLDWHFALSKSRLVTLAVLIAGLAQSRSVNLSHLAVHLCGPVCHASKYRRLQRFFQFVRLDQAVAARLVVYMLNLERRKYLALDRNQLEARIARHQHPDAGDRHKALPGAAAVCLTTASGQLRHGSPHRTDAPLS